MTSITKNQKNTSLVKLYNSVELKQNLSSSFLSIKRIDLFLDDNEKFNDEIANVNIYKNNKKVFSKQYLLKEQEDDIIHINVKDSITCDKKSKLEIVVSCPSCTKSNSLNLYRTSKFDKDNSYYLDSSKKNYALKLELFGYRYNYNYFIFFTLLFFLMLFFYFLHYDEKKYIINKKYFFFEFIISIASFIMLYFNLVHYLYGLKMNLIISFLNIILFIFLMKTVVIIVKNSIGNYPNLYLALVMPIIFIYSLFVIPNYVPDEPAHFMRAYDLINHSLISNRINAKIPDDVIKYNLDVIDNYDDLNHVLFKPTNYNKKITFATSANTYSYVLYFFADIGVIIGKIFSLPIMMTMYLSRFINSLVMILFGYLIIKNLPFGKNIAFIYLLTPMYLHEGCSISADSLVNSICLLFIAIILKYRNAKKISKYDMWLIFAIILLLGFAKYVYIPLILLVYLILKNRNIENKKYKKYLKWMMFLSITLCMLMFIKIYLLPMFHEDTSNNNISSVGMIGQLKYILYNPIYAIKTIHSTLFLMGPEYIKTFFGRYLGWLNINVNQYVTWVYAILLISSPYINVGYETDFLSKKEKIFFLIMTASLLFIVICSMWLFWTPIGTSPVSGIQGRYFIPFMLMLFLVLASKNKKIKFEHYDIIVSVLIVILNLSVLLSFVQYFK